MAAVGPSPTLGVEILGHELGKLQNVEFPETHELFTKIAFLAEGSMTREHLFKLIYTCYVGNDTS